MLPVVISDKVGSKVNIRMLVALLVIVTEEFTIVFKADVFVSVRAESSSSVSIPALNLLPFNPVPDDINFVLKNPVGTRVIHIFEFIKPALVEPFKFLISDSKLNLLFIHFVFINKNGKVVL